MTINPQVSIVMGSDSDLPVMEDAAKTLKEFGVAYEMIITSAHRAPEMTTDFAKKAAPRGIKVVIAGAGYSAHLAGVIAAQTVIPVIGVPLAVSPLQGVDALLAMGQMPSGIPVATVTIGKAGAKNAALLAVEILALSDGSLQKKLVEYRRKLAAEVKGKNRKLK
ncbi:MAG: 5-(carboxyamino)imidazole ribonucleotide mutase [Deltaproteobacteria bacterium]|nr:5-(carboxyamino)imidazole ribonucleotide mutase [Deltaproteobacteria bacterium]MBI2974025.1 5-(carboxyamino)imidazole ribonucleotide mutase [Deltaproteobacteria bacterium]